MIIVALLFLLITPSEPQDTSRALERLVQAAVLDSLFTRDTTQRIVVGDSTISGGKHFVDEDYRTALKILGSLPAGLQADFERVRHLRRAVDSLPAKALIVSFTAAERAKLREAAQRPIAYWSAFYQRFPHSPGWVELSRAGFSRDGNTAMVLAEYRCGGLCGGTRYILLQRRAGRWLVVKVAEPRMA